MPPPFRVLILCTGNSARSQILEALLNARGAGKIMAESAGVRPATRVHPLAVRVLREAGFDPPTRQPRAMDAVTDRPWDLVITVCDHAKEVCPVFPGARMLHWGMPDPAAVQGDEEERLAAFREALHSLSARADQLAASPDV